MKIVIIGGSGLIGARLAKKLTDRGHDPRLGNLHLEDSLRHAVPA